MADKQFIMAIATLVGTIIGAGVLGIPYAISKSGFIPGMIILVILGFAVLILNLCVGEVALRTKGRHQLPGYAEKYLGKWGKHVMSFSIIFAIYGALIAYFIGSGNVLADIFNLGNWSFLFLGLEISASLMFSICFFVILSTLIYFGLKSVGNTEIVFGAIMLIIIFIIIVWGFFHLDSGNLTSYNKTQLFFPYGVILFAFVGAAAIPEMKSICSNNKKLIKKAIIIGSAIPLVVYALFALVVVGATGTSTGQIATTTLGNVVGGKIMELLGNLFAIFSMSTSFLALGLALLWVYDLDLHRTRNVAFALTVSVPFLIGILGVTSFIQALAITGGVAGGIEGILIILMFWKAKKLGDRKPEYSINISKVLGILLMVMFVLGILYQFF
ncbi:amino acid permease [Candidatus Woesearchaeota archaeon]|nr:amino acid permease [Candidatus Woesearchaeota archaeon]MBT5342552.1 amino acid permease [Candidatus Woesearchaeota archaeon]